MQVVDPCEATLAKAPAEGQGLVDPPSGRPAAGIDPIEPVGFFGKPHEGRCRQQGDFRFPVVAANGGEGAERLHEIAECAELDDKYAGSVGHVPSKTSR